ncbi:ABC transporter permease [Limnochorda pilosa]|uniref:ABC3 transporter permease protein domain-containing protein n=1 Tax=Limnochorda pilosa TaxID=1555112 RepID=A0A0K2SP14_LIMPI|nr:ABC transporter permease [Limnochorda pilosa]BAS28569.1 hypothetical protein LIP_2739 [Limnochorda pilosa]
MPFTWRRLTANWLATVLGILQVGVAIGAVVALLSSVLPALGRGATPSFLEASYHPTRASSDGAGPAAASLFEPQDAALVRHEVDGVTHAATLARQPLVVIEAEGRRHLVRSVGATEPDYFRLTGLQAVAGALFGPAEMAQGAGVAVLSEVVARQLFGEPADALNREIVMLSVEEGLVLQGRLGALPHGMTYPPRATLKVAGVFRRPETASAASVDLLQPEVLVPIGWLEPDGGARTGGAGPFRGHRADTLYVAAASRSAEDVRREMKVLLEPLLEERRLQQALESDDRSSTWELQVTLGGFAGRVQERSRALSGVLVGAVLAAVVAAGLAIGTAGLVHTMEHTHAIGLYRALGATRGRIMGRVAAESVGVAGMGALLGVGLAWPMQRLLGPLLALLPTASPEQHIQLAALGIGVGLALAVGLVAGWYPGWLATRWSATEALREE